MRADVRVLLALPLRHWRRWNHAIEGQVLNNGNCHYAATAAMLDLIEGSRARGWRIATGFTRMQFIKEPVLHSWVESPAGAVIDVSQVYRVGRGLAVSRDFWFREFEVRPLVKRRPGQVSHAVRRFGFVTAAVLPLTQLLDATASVLL